MNGFFLRSRILTLNSTEIANGDNNSSNDGALTVVIVSILSVTILATVIALSIFISRKKSSALHVKRRISENQNRINENSKSNFVPTYLKRFQSGMRFDAFEKSKSVPTGKSSSDSGKLRSFWKQISPKCLINSQMRTFDSLDLFPNDVHTTDDNDEDDGNEKNTTNEC